MWAPVVVKILEDFQEVSLVLSTSWVRKLSFKRAMGFLPSDLGNRVTGATWRGIGQMKANETDGRVTTRSAGMRLEPSLRNGCHSMTTLKDRELPRNTAWWPAIPTWASAIHKHSVC